MTRPSSLIREATANRDDPQSLSAETRQIVNRCLAASLHHRWISTGQGILPGNRTNRRSMGRVEVGVLGFAMPPQVDLPLKSSAAKLAGERLEARMFPRMRDQVAALRKRLAAHLALVRFFACDNKKMKDI